MRKYLNFKRKTSLIFLILTLSGVIAVPPLSYGKGFFPPLKKKTIPEEEKKSTVEFLERLQIFYRDLAAAAQEAEEDRLKAYKTLPMPKQEIQQIETKMAVRGARKARIMDTLDFFFEKLIDAIKNNG